MRQMKVKVAANGRLSLPVAVRRALGVEKGGDLLLQVGEGEVVLTPLDEVVRRVQARVRKLTLDRQVSVEDFLAWKRKQAELEARPTTPESEAS